MNLNLVSVADGRGMIQHHDQIVGRDGKFGALAVHGDAADIETHGVEFEFRDVLPQRGDLLSHFSAHLPLVEVKPEMRADVLQVVVAAPGVGLIRARCGGRHKRCP